ncbi:MAG TPA: hydroxymethylglutaryl-CoA lyase [Chthoniobacterales bacterium]|nr:hydroxymethylglutaryl-CoA lyase [Chthoniobacterales bacterium]
MPNDPVKLIECPRDAWQGLKRQIPTELKVQYLRALIDAGFKHIDAVSFVSPKSVPQMADSEEVLGQLQPPSNIEIIGIVVNEKGAERAIATQRVTTVGYPYSISPTFLRKNQSQSPKENWEVLRAVKKRAEEAQRDVVVYISMAFGNPYRDPWNKDGVKEGVKRIVDLGIRSISLADTVGAATPELVGRVVGPVISDYGNFDIGVHLHSTRADAAAKILAAYDAGCRRFDSALGSLGGCPFAQDALVGNIPTEIVLEAVLDRAVDLSMLPKIDKVVTLNAEIASRFGS